MSIFPKNQPIIFEPYLPDECRSDLYIYKSIAEHEDDITFQVKVNPCSGSQNVIVYPDFSEFESVNWLYSGGFTLDGGNACKADDGSTGSVEQQNVFAIGTSYQIQIQVVSLVGEIKIYNGASVIYTVTQTGLTTFNFTAVATNLIIAIENGDYYGCVKTISARSFSPNMAFGIIDENGDTAAVASYELNPEYFTFKENTVTIKAKWSDFELADGCYTIGFAEGCNNNGQLGAFNEKFDNCLYGWETVIGTLTTVTCEQLENPETGAIENCIEFTDAGQSGYIYNQITELIVGLPYRITVDAMSTDADGFLRIYCGTSFNDFYLSGDTDTNLVCTGNGVFRIEAHMETSTFIRLWGVTLTISTEPENQIYYRFDYESQQFKVQDTHQCTHMINLSNNDNAFDFVFEGTGFAPCVRLESEIYDSTPEEIRKSYLDNQGTKKVYFGETRKHFFFVITHMPAWLIDFFYMCRIADHFIIDQVEYFIESDASTPEWADGITNFGVLRMEISEKTQLYRNQNSGNIDRPVFANAQNEYLTAPVHGTLGGDIILEITTGTQVTVK